MANPFRMSSDDTGLWVIDLQEKLTPRIVGIESIVHNVAFLVDAAHILGVQVQATEQYPKGLGSTLPEIAARIPERPDKVTFSSCAIPSVIERMEREARTKVLLCGIETHVCVMQTVLDLLVRRYQVYVAVDAVGSRYTSDHRVALERMQQAGATLVTSEMAVFEWTTGADHPRFKDISRLVQERMKKVLPN